MVKVAPKMLLAPMTIQQVWEVEQAPHQGPEEQTWQVGLVSKVLMPEVAEVPCPLRLEEAQLPGVAAALLAAAARLHRQHARLLTLLALGAQLWHQLSPSPSLHARQVPSLSSPP